MARNTKRGKCELCGEMANVGMNHGTAACTKCTHIQAALANRPQAVARAARSMGKAEDLIKALIPDGGSLAVQVTATLLQEISGIVGYEGEDPAELVEAVRKRALTCASCEAEDVLREIREIVGYTPEQGDKGLAEAVLAFADRRPADVQDCADCTALDDLGRSTRVIEGLRAKLTIAQQARDEWEQRAVYAEQNVELLESELKEAETRNGKLQYQIAGYAPEPCASTTYLLDIALAVIREEPVPAGKIAGLIEAARRAA